MHNKKVRKAVIRTAWSQMDAYAQHSLYSLYSWAVGDNEEALYNQCLKFGSPTQMLANMAKMGLSERLSQYNLVVEDCGWWEVSNTFVFKIKNKHDDVSLIKNIGELIIYLKEMGIDIVPKVSMSDFELIPNDFSLMDELLDTFVLQCLSEYARENCYNSFSLAESHLLSNNNREKDLVLLAMQSLEKVLNDFFLKGITDPSLPKPVVLNETACLIDGVEVDLNSYTTFQSIRSALDLLKNKYKPI